MIYVILIIVALLLFILFLIFCNCRCSKNINNKLALETFSNSTNSKVVIFKTHIWNDEIEKFTGKIYEETTNANIDFYILIHDNKGNLYKKIPNFVKPYTIVFSQDDIEKIYKSGFIDMWLSNHWILMWFFRTVNEKYDYYWSIEYDVRVTGDGNKLWNWQGSEDFIYPIEPFMDSSWRWKDYYYGNIFTDDTKWYGYLQLARYSKRFLQFLDKFYADGENGQDEMVTFSLFKMGESVLGFTGTHTILNDLIRDSWSVSGEDSDKHKEILKQYENGNEIVIIHPVK